MESEKRKRGANYSFSERKHLLRITNKWKHVIENKKTDAVTWREKEEVWKKIETEYNSTNIGIPRNAKQLKTKYELIKKERKKQYSSHKAYLLGTGGGNHIEEPKPEMEEEKQLLETIAVAANGLASKFDSDASAGVGGIPTEEVESDRTVTIEYRDVDWSGPSAGFLQTPVNPALKQDETFYVCGRSGSEIHTMDEGIVALGEHVNESITVDTEQQGTPIKNSWTNRRSPVITKKKCMGSASAKFEVLAEKKLELVKLQISAAEDARRQNEKEHQLRVRNLELEQDILLEKLLQMKQNRMD